MSDMATPSVPEAALALRRAMAESVRRHSLWFIVQGVLLVIAGLFALIFPAISTVAVVLVLGWLLIASGILQAISLVGARHAPHFWLQLMSVVLSVIVGILLLSRPGEGIVALTLLLIVFFMMEGVAKVVLALTIRPMKNWAFILLSGLVGIVVALVLWSSLPLSATWLLGILLGIHLVVQGSCYAYFAWTVRRDSRAAP
jgi:uncharacterized membrane protein HdeD (DUF308 family)